MTPQTLFYIIIGILILSFSIDKILDYLNAQHFNDELPADISDVYDKEEYQTSQRYKTENYKFGLITSIISIAITLAFFFFNGPVLKLEGQLVQGLL